MKKGLSDVDIIIPTRNRIEDLRITIKKMLAIGFDEEQFYVIDDQSADSTPDIIRSEFPDITLEVNQSPRGQLRNRNTLCRMTSRKYVLSLDDDSHIRSAEDVLEAIEILEKTPSAGIFAFRAFEQMHEPPSKEELEADVVFTRTFIACGCLIKRSVLNDIEEYTREALGYYCEEIDCSIRAFVKGYRVISKRNIVVHHRVNRNYKNMPKHTDLKKGIYGSIWRSAVGFSDNLIVTGIYYPPLLDVGFSFLYVGKRFLFFAIKNRDYEGFFKGLLRYTRHIPYVLSEAQKMPYSLFMRWIKLPAM